MRAVGHPAHNEGSLGEESSQGRANSSVLGHLDWKKLVLEGSGQCIVLQNLLNFTIFPFSDLVRDGVKTEEMLPRSSLEETR